MPPQCLQRVDGCGFEGSPDIYGLGIRLGLYCQWLAALLGFLLPTEDVTSLVASYMVFSVAITIATFVLAFDTDCVFDVEIIILLCLFFTGTPLHINTFGTNLGLRSTESEKLDNIIGLLMYSSLYPMLGFSSWFWVAMTLRRTAKLQPAPCGSHFFLFAHVTPNHLILGSGFQAAIAILFCCLFVVPTVFLALQRMVPQSRPSAATSTSAEPEATGHSPHGSARTSRIQFTLYLLLFVELQIMIYGILAVDLTLRWNGIVGVNEIKSVGQLIPFIVGVSLLLQTLYLVWKEQRG